MAWGYRPTTLAYPFGAVDSDARVVARRCGYDAARAVGGLKEWGCPGCPAGEATRPADRYAIRTPGSVREDTLLRQIRQQVLNAEKDGGGLGPLVFHRVCDDCGLYSVTPERLNGFLGWLAARKSRGTVVKTLQSASAPVTALCPARRRPGRGREVTVAGPRRCQGPPVSPNRRRRAARASRERAGPGAGRRPPDGAARPSPST